MFVSVKYFKTNLGGYHGAEYTYRTDLPLVPGDQVIAPTYKEPRTRGLVMAVGLPEPPYQCRVIDEYDPEGNIVEGV